MSTPSTPHEIVQGLRETMSISEIARELGRSPRMVYKILRGETKGELYRPTLEQLRDEGRATTRPPRRRDSHGNIVPVRAPAAKDRADDGTDTPATVIPEDTGGTYVEQPKRGRFSTETTYFDDGGRLTEIRMPKTKKAKGREEGREEALRVLRSGAKRQRHGQKRAKVRVTFDDGRTMELGSKGGYAISDLLSRSNEAEKDPVEFLMTQTFGASGTARYANYDPSGHQITGISVTVYNATRKDEA